MLAPPTPPIPTEIPGLEVAAGYWPAASGEGVSGDFYDMFEIGPGDWMVAIGDVSGKGFDAAALTVLIRDTIREAAFRNPQPSHVLGSLNRELLERPTTLFCTAALIRLRRAGDCWKTTLSLGGHPLPLLLEAEGSDPIALGRPGSLIGALHSAEYHDRDVLLTPGAQIVLYTDGVCEARRETEYYGEDRLRALLAGRVDSAAATAGAVLDDVLAFQSDQPRDDIAVVVLRVPIRDGSRRRLIRWYCTACDVWGQDMSPAICWGCGTTNLEEKYGPPLGEAYRSYGA
jgi:sigma-B regulation protein RsbU (phosphoserine phosphatase)